VAVPQSPANQQGWPGSLLLEYDSFIRVHEDREANFDFILPNKHSAQDAPAKGGGQKPRPVGGVRQCRFKNEI
jgi:hypothetical protein